ncbi:MAG: sigma-70 family RNA polymerase sigma factor [Lachnospiraceae bacterium]|nr:sigma-70 family RNA polymerase sigma factor [Lachnospiraceae bacterium]
MGDYLNEQQYDQISDEDLVAIFQSGNMEMGSYMIHRFYPLVQRCARHLFLTGAETEDLYQEGTVGLFEAMKKFEVGRNTHFQTFASACIMNYQLKAVEAANRLKHSPLNTYISLYSTDDANKELIDTLESKEYDDPEKLFLSMENYRDLRAKVYEILSPFENKVLDAYLSGGDYKDISLQLNKEEKSIDNAMQRIRRKIKKQFS